MSPQMALASASDIEGFVIVIGVIWGILNIILFFKIWGMTNNVEKILETLKNLESVKSKKITLDNITTRRDTENSNSMRPVQHDEGQLKVGSKVSVGDMRGVISAINCDMYYVSDEKGDVFIFKESDLKLLNENQK